MSISEHGLAIFCTHWRVFHTKTVRLKICCLLQFLHNLFPKKWQSCLHIVPIFFPNPAIIYLCEYRQFFAQFFSFLSQEKDLFNVPLSIPFSFCENLPQRRVVAKWQMAKSAKKLAEYAKDSVCQECKQLWQIRQKIQK